MTVVTKKADNCCVSWGYEDTSRFDPGTYNIYTGVADNLKPSASDTEAYTYTPGGGFVAV